MSLQSMSLRGNARLQKCLVSDPAHVQKGDRGDHVSLIQSALSMLDNFKISNEEQCKQLYGQSTANAVLAYKKKRKIINFSYQKSADNIVGKMTIRALDTEMLAQERARFRLLLSFGATISPPKMSILSEGHFLATNWANHARAANPANVVVTSAPANETAEKNVVVIKEAIGKANGGLLVLNVGHGLCLAENSKGNTAEGAFDAAPDRAMRIGGKNMDADKGIFVNVFYDDKPESRKDGGLVPKSEKDRDEESGTPAAKQRLKNWSIYQDLCKAFIEGGLGGVVLATCKVGRATDFLKKVAQQWRTPIIAYRDTWMFYETPSRRSRAIMLKDQGRENTLTPGTNTVFGEVMFPLSMIDMALIRP